MRERTFDKLRKERLKSDDTSKMLADFLKFSWTQNLDNSHSDVNSPA